MKTKSLYILFAAGLLVALTACEPKYDYSWTPYVVMDETAVSIAEDDSLGILTLGVTAYAKNGSPITEVGFKLIDGDGDNGAKQGIDYTLISPASGMLYFEGESTLYIQIRISNANVGIYTGRKTFYVELDKEGLTNGYNLGGAYSTTVTITDADRNLDAVGIEGTYEARGAAYTASGPVEQTWELTIHQDETNPDLYWIDGLTPTDVGLYDYGGTTYCAQGYYTDGSQEVFAIPSQVLNYTSNGYYVGYTPCVDYISGNGYYSSDTWPDLTFTMKDSDNWESDYGIFLGAFTSTNLSSMVSFFDVVTPTIKITRID